MRILFLLLTAVLAARPVAADPGYKAGTATHQITPTEPLWMAGYSSRTKPCDTKHHDWNEQIINFNIFIYGRFCKKSEEGKVRGRALWHDGH